MGGAREARGARVKAAVGSRRLISSQVQRDGETETPTDALRSDPGCALRAVTLLTKKDDARAGALPREKDDAGTEALSKEMDDARAGALPREKDDAGTGALPKGKDDARAGALPAGNGSIRGDARAGDAADGSRRESAADEEKSRKRARVDELPAEAREAIEDMLAEGRRYQEIADALDGFGFIITKGAIGRHEAFKKPDAR